MPDRLASQGACGGAPPPSACKSTIDQKAWGKHRVVVAGEGGDEQRGPAGDGCFECMDTAAERWPHEGWGQARIAGSEDERRRLVAMVAVRAGRQKPDFLPTSVNTRTSLTAKWVDTRVPMDVDVLERTPGLRDPRQAGLAITTYKNGVGETKEAVMVSDPQYPPRLELSTEVSSERVELTLDGAQQIEDSQAREIFDAPAEQIATGAARSCGRQQRRATYKGAVV